MCKLSVKVLLVLQIQQRYDKVRNECLQQRSKLLDEVKGTKQTMDSDYSLGQPAPSLSILPRTRTQVMCTVYSVSCLCHYMCTGC